jgi:predicted transcriptional regulator
MKPEDAEEFTQALGQVVAGSYRQIVLARNLGVPKALGMSVEDWVHKRLGGYVKLSIEERKEAAKELMNEGMTQREAAEVLGVDQSTISGDLKVDENPSKKAHPNREIDENPSTETEAQKQKREAKEQEQALQQTRVVRALHLFTVLGTLGLGKGSPAQKASEILDYDLRTFKTTQLKVTGELWKEAMDTLKECAKQWEKKHVCTGPNNSKNSDS